MFRLVLAGALDQHHGGLDTKREFGRGLRPVTGHTGRMLY
jgi:hypothetical protein